MANHKWVETTPGIGHGSLVCEYCYTTDKEAAALGELLHCPKAPNDGKASSDGNDRPSEPEVKGADFLDLRQTIEARRKMIDNLRGSTYVDLQRAKAVHKELFGESKHNHMQAYTSQIADPEARQAVVLYTESLFNSLVINHNHFTLEQVLCSTIIFLHSTAAVAATGQGVACLAHALEESLFAIKQSSYQRLAEDVLENVLYPTTPN